MGPSPAIRGEACVGSNNEGKLSEIGATAREGFESNVIEDETGGSGVVKVDGEEGEQDAGAAARGLRIDGGGDKLI